MVDFGLLEERERERERAVYIVVNMDHYSSVKRLPYRHIENEWCRLPRLDL